MNFNEIIAFILIQSFTTSAFVAPNAFLSSAAPRVAVASSAMSLSNLPPSILLTDEMNSNTENVPVGFEDAFQDDIVLFDSTIQLLAIGFGVLVVLALAAKFLLNQMDSAIEKVLVEFETTMKGKYASRWVSIEAKLDGLVEPERSQRLFAIMEELQVSEPDFMAQVNRDMGS